MQTSGAAEQLDFRSSPALRNDACLHDICFVDTRQGWAVGDRGTIWHTADGGRNWQLQTSGVACPLYSVCFLDAQTGWAAGGGLHPFLHTTFAVLLHTQDGGRHWEQMPVALLPALRRVRFFNRREGFAAGVPSPLFPSGVFFTRDGGRSWHALAGASESCWLDADFADPLTGVLAGMRGTAGMARHGAVQPARMGSFGLRPLHRVAIGSRLQAWLAGDGGLLMTSPDLGASWQTPPAELPEGLAQQFDFQALCVRAQRVWAAGTPGTRIVFSPDGGHSWQVQPTGVNVPLRAIWFADSEHGWAAGELGTILATTDGGRSWRRQRAGGSRAALLGLFARAEEVPLELLARLAGEEGYLSAVYVVGRRDVDGSSSEQALEPARLREAVLAAGGSAAGQAWRFPLWPEGLGMDADRLVELWDQTNDHRALRRLEAEIVRRIRLWRPEVIITSAAQGSTDDPAAQVLNWMVLRAVEEAADPTAFADQMILAGLSPWQVKKVFARAPDARSAEVRLAGDRLAPRLGRSLGEIAAEARGLLVGQYQPPAEMLGFDLLVCRLPAGSGRTDFFAGIALEPGGEARRALLPPVVENLDQLRRMAQRRRHTEAILRRLEQLSPHSEALLAQTSELSTQLDASSACAVLYHLGRKYCDQGRWQSAADTFRLLAQRYPHHPLARRAMVWLVHYYASTETLWRIEGTQRAVIAQTTVQLPGDATAGPHAAQPAVHLQGRSALSVDADTAERRRRLAVDLARELQRGAPELFSRPEVQLSLAAAYRQLGYQHEARRIYLGLAHSARRDAWWACAQGEQWLSEPHPDGPKPVVRCRLAAEKPRLDGRLDEPLWQAAQPARLTCNLPDNQPWPGEVRFACDGEFLYLGVRCRKAPGATYQMTEAPRPRDPDLSGEDRVEILLDLDRDYATWYRLVVDHRGWVAEDCWGEKSWNPTWFVARGADQQQWTAEAAIPLDQLAGRYPQPREVWAVGVQRVIPGVGFQSWSTPAAPQVRPEGFGYLIFE